MIDNLDKIIPTLKCKHRKLKFLYVNSDIRGLTMEKNETGRHISKQFDLELEEIRNKVLAMGGFVEYQILEAAKSLVDGDYDRAALVITNDLKVNKDEIRIDEDCNYIIARRQPTASDMRLVLAVIKIITDLERIGDLAGRIARMGQRLAEEDRPKNSYAEIQIMAEHVAGMLRGALDAFARLDVKTAYDVANRDLLVDEEFDGNLRQIVTHMSENPRSISHMLHVAWTARAIERIGDHAKNICEYVIYLVEGKDVRHTCLEEM